MSEFLYSTMTVLAILILVYLYRVIAGPTVFDRLLGLNGISTKAILLVVVIGTIYGRVDMFVDISTGYALLNLVSALAVTKYFEHRRSV
ncbi:MAG: putative monovalent cation/H+ antiporter, subunit F [Nitrospira sp.]|nr:MAG: putative monovalent cation/H+ antiporter, subunit F [Nitrospira sp.]